MSKTKGLDDRDYIVIRRCRAIIILGPEITPTVKEHVEMLFDEFIRKKIMPLFTEVDWQVIG
jgi:hypothetical protein